MESENEVSTGSIPADHIGEQVDEPFNAASMDGLHLEPKIPAGGAMAHEFPPREHKGPTHLHHNELPHNEHRIVEMELRTAHERIEKLQWDVAHAEKKLADSQKQSFEEISVLRGELSTTAEAGQNKVKALESEAAHLQEELNASTHEVSNLRKSLQRAEQDHGELLSQVDGLKENMRMLEGQLCDSGMKATKVEESLLAQVEACQTELGAKAADLESIRKAYGELQLEFEEVRSKSRDSESALTTASKQAEEYQKELKNQEAIAKEALDESSRLKHVVEEAEAKCKEAEQKVKNLDSELSEAKAQILENDQVRKLLEETNSEKARIEEEGCQMKDELRQLEGQLADEKARVADLQDKMQNAEVELRSQEDRLKVTESTTVMVKEEVATLQCMLKGAEDELKAKEEAAFALQEEVTNLKTEVSEVLRTSEENLKKLEEELQGQIKASEERCEALQKSLSELEGKTAQLQDSLGVAQSDSEIARRRVVEQELELENLLQSKSKFEESAAELQTQLKSSEGMLTKQTDSLKVAEQNADKANEQVEHLQSVLSITEEKLRASEEVAESLQLQVTDLTSREAKSAEQHREVVDGLQKTQLELESKLEISEGNFKSLVSQLEEKAAMLEESLAAAALEVGGGRKKVSDLEGELDRLHQIQRELEEKVRLSEEECSQHENSALNLRTRGLELEGLITEHKTKVDDANGKVATLEAALVNTQNKTAELERMLKLAHDNISLLEETSVARITELERCIKEYEAKYAELEMACAGAKSKEQDTLEKLHSTEKMLEERQTEVSSAAERVNELDSSIKAMESDLEGALKREKLVIEEKAIVEEQMLKLETLIAKLEAEKTELESIAHQHKSLAEKGKVDLHDAAVQEQKLREEILSLQAAKSELQDLLSQIEIEKQTTITQLDSTQKIFVQLNEQLVEERQQLQQKITTIMQENGDLTQKLGRTQEKLDATLAAGEVSAKQVQEASLKESTLNAQMENLNLQLRKALAHVETLEQENGDLAQKFDRAQEKLDATLESAEVSGRQLQEVLLTQSALNAEIEDLKVQLRKAMDTCSQVEKLEQVLKNSITAEEHQKQIDQLLATSRLAESKLADVEEQLSKSKLEISKAQKNSNQQETHVKELESKTLQSVEIFDQKPPESTKQREIDLDFQNPGKVRNRKKKGVTWEADGEATVKAKALEKPAKLPTYGANQFVAHLLIAVASLAIGFWAARVIHL